MNFKHIINHKLYKINEIENSDKHLVSKTIKLNICEKDYIYHENE